MQVSLSILNKKSIIGTKMEYLIGISCISILDKLGRSSQNLRDIWENLKKFLCDIWCGSEVGFYY